MVRRFPAEAPGVHRHGHVFFLSERCPLTVFVLAKIEVDTIHRLVREFDWDGIRRLHRNGDTHLEWEGNAQYLSKSSTAKFSVQRNSCRIGNSIEVRTDIESAADAGLIQPETALINLGIDSRKEIYEGPIATVWC